LIGSNAVSISATRSTNQITDSRRKTNRTISSRRTRTARSDIDGYSANSKIDCVDCVNSNYAAATAAATRIRI
jgi:hypothetical protein